LNLLAAAVVGQILAHCALTDRWSRVRQEFKV
jgi:uncharacterized integral membrane protein